MLNLDSIPAPGPDCTEWRTICDGWYRLYGGGKGIQYAYPDGHWWADQRGLTLFGDARDP